MSTRTSVAEHAPRVATITNVFCDEWSIAIVWAVGKLSRIGGDSIARTDSADVMLRDVLSGSNELFGLKLAHELMRFPIGAAMACRLPATGPARGACGQLRADFSSAGQVHAGHALAFFNGA